MGLLNGYLSERRSEGLTTELTRDDLKNGERKLRELVGTRVRVYVSQLGQTYEGPLRYDEIFGYSIEHQPGNQVVLSI